jgi:hypothetical protein
VDVKEEGERRGVVPGREDAPQIHAGDFVFNNAGGDRAD